MPKTTVALALGAALAFAAPAARAEIDGHGPDAWRVTGVAANDRLNMRVGPGTQYPVIDSLAPDARGLEQITCVPLLIPSVAQKLSEAERASLPPRWCLMRTGDMLRAGWVAQRFLMEDVAQESGARPTGQGAAPVETIGDALIDRATGLVAALYTAFEAPGGARENPFAPGRAAGYFFADLVPELSGHGADLLYDAQDFQGAITRIAPDPAQPMLRGMITVIVDFTNFGRPDRATFRLRADTTQPGAPLRIFRIEHDGWQFP